MDLHTSCNRELYAAWDYQVWACKLPLKRPLICIDAMASAWGMWEPQSRCITLSAKLVETQPWHVVIEILKHEMAHQVADEVIGGKDCHGESFHKACQWLGVREEFRRARLTISEEIPDWRMQESLEAAPLMRKVEKLLALAESANEYEAALAMQKVQILLAQLNIERIGQRVQAKYFSLFIPLSSKRVETTHKIIFSLLVEFYFVEVIFLDHYDVKDETTYKVVELVGTRENVLMAEYVYQFLANRMVVLWENHQRSSRCETRLRRSYQVGLLHGFRSRLNEGKSLATARATADGQRENWLICCADPSLHAHVKELHPRLVSKSGSGANLDSAGYQQGKNDGRKIVLSRAVGDRKSTPGGFLQA